jgi:photosystem II stability/assembly factor-like uncharacterized protein
MKIFLILLLGLYLVGCTDSKVQALKIDSIKTKSGAILTFWRSVEINGNPISLNNPLFEPEPVKTMSGFSSVPLEEPGFKGLPQFIRTIACDPSKNILYIGGNDGISISKDNGLTFTTKSFQAGLPHYVREIVIQDDELIVNTETGRYLSRNEGESFVPVSPKDPEVGFGPMSCSMNGSDYAITKGQLMISHDSGKTFSIFNNRDQIVSSLINGIFVNNKQIYIATSEGLYVSNDAGVSFNLSRAGDYLSVDSDGENIYALKTKIYPEDTRLEVSHDGGNSFQSTDFAFQEQASSMKVIGKEIYIMGPGYVSFSNDGGNSFIKMSKYKDLAINKPGIFKSEDNLYLRLCENYKPYLLVTNDFGKTYKDITPALAGSCFGIRGLVFSDSKFVSVGFNDKIYTSKDNGLTFDQGVKLPCYESNILDWAVSGSNVVITCYNSSVFKSNDYGKTFFDINLEGSYKGRFTGREKITPARIALNKDIVYVANMGLYRSGLPVYEKPKEIQINYRQVNQTLKCSLMLAKDDFYYKFISKDPIQWNSYTLELEKKGWSLNVPTATLRASVLFNNKKEFEVHKYCPNVKDLNIGCSGTANLKLEGGPIELPLQPLGEVTAQFCTPSNNPSSEPSSEPKICADDLKYFVRADNLVECQK